ncbi:hypothetical protein SAMN04515671_1317 [Nakamurella panacisegetis]|uniref:Uncharacterized protein n=1 Tax=Nakamurella panacisegetis TaxID=1090615 RepID=A0A1H0KI52_9ACTN|nr:hypothetical protein [Nakamurella panacisegetis]SDO55607.1 hypothetical protein SAMN04515671_1317 [Nakamurella panacisegetis]
MTTLMTRMRPIVSHPRGLRRLQRRPVGRVPLPAAEERLVSGPELEVLRARIVVDTTRLK